MDWRPIYYRLSRATMRRVPLFTNTCRRNHRKITVLMSYLAVFCHPIGIESLQGRSFGYGLWIQNELGAGTAEGWRSFRLRRMQSWSWYLRSCLQSEVEKQVRKKKYVPAPTANLPLPCRSSHQLFCITQPIAIMRVHITALVHGSIVHYQILGWSLDSKTMWCAISTSHGLTLLALLTE